MPIVAKLDEFGRPAWIILTILGFLVWWPIGLAALAFMIGSGRMGCWHHHGSYAHWQDKMERMQSRMDRMRGHMERMGDRDWWGPPRSSGNRAFDDYRTETLRRLEEEQREFQEFLQRLRASPRTRPSSINSWPSAATARRLRRSRRPRKPEHHRPWQQAVRRSAPGGFSVRTLTHSFASSAIR
jgi:Protein of unknown function (DUF2852)